MLILTSCLLISLVEKVPFWWTSSVSDHSVLFLLFGGVGAAALLQGFWGTPGDLPSPLNEACRWESPRSQICCKWKPSWVVQHAKQLRGDPSSPFLGWHMRLPGWFGRSAGRPHSSPERWGWLATSPCREDGHACCWVPGEARETWKKRLVRQWIIAYVQEHRTNWSVMPTGRFSQRPQLRVQTLSCDILMIKHIHSSHKSSLFTPLPAFGRGNRSSWSRGRAAGRQTGGPADRHRYWGAGNTPAAVGSIMWRVLSQASPLSTKTLSDCWSGGEGGLEECQECTRPCSQLFNTPPHIHPATIWPDNSNKSTWECIYTITQTVQDKCFLIAAALQPLSPERQSSEDSVAVCQVRSVKQTTAVSQGKEQQS